MSYTIRLTIRNSTSDTLTVVEKTCWYYANGGIWTEQDCQYVLSMGGSGTSGILRFKSSSGETFTAILGIHNYKPWCDVQVNLRDDDTAVKLLPEYYNGGALSGEAHGEIFKGTCHGKWVGITFDKADGHELSAVLHYYADRDGRVY
ncbi:hypothetical protein CNMCM5623_004845 [Aspergillus felis]|uniref:Fungal fruit body lectin n=1 Tax=Aspergillus felis TaxID=1287682 RepID=A0A8H6QWV7_9EURO|nr:hypothetical protein CNMCM5623_004845 [Aspergillus felis]KAF7181095.1 hypothetical protein CNMCM7691_000224 [Aspergillus felis]